MLNVLISITFQFNVELNLRFIFRQMEEEGVDTLVKLFDLSSRDPQKSSRPQVWNTSIS